MNVYIKINIYKHQKCSIIFNITTNFILLMIFSCLTKIENDKNYQDFVGKNTYEIIDTITGFTCSFIPIFIGFIFLFFIKSFAKVKTKVFMDFYFISPYKMILVIGLNGIILTIIGLFISSFSKCKEDTIIKKYICINEKNNTNYYFDSIFIYLHDLKNNSLIIEIILTFFYLII